MPTTNRGYIYPATTAPATVPADLRAPLEQIDADVQTLTDQMSATVRLNPDGTLPEVVESRVEVIAREFGSPMGMIPVFPTLAEAQAWELANPGRMALTVETPPDPAAWPPAAPVFSISSGTYTIPDDAGAVYTVDGVTKAAGTHSIVAPVTVTVVAVAKPGYTLAGVTEWTQAFPVILNAYDAEAVKAPVYFRLDEAAPVNRDSLVNRGTAETVAWFNVEKGITVGNFGHASVGVGPRAVLNAIGPQNFAMPGSTFTFAAVFADVTGTSTGTGASLGGVTFLTHPGNGSIMVSGLGTGRSDLKPMPDRFHAAVTWTEGTGRVYVDGDLVVTAAVASPAAPGYLKPPQVHESGRVGGLVLDTSRAWTDAEIKALSNGVER